MADNRLNGMRVAILVSTDFEQSEMVQPRQALDQAGAKTVLISTQPGTVRGMNHDQLADTFNVDMTLDDVNPDDFDAVMLPGGVINADQLRVHRKAQDFVRRLDETDRPIAAICHAPWLLVSAGLVSGRDLTSYYTLQDDVRNAGGHWLDLAPVRDGNWVTARGPKDIPDFNLAMIDLFEEHLLAQQEAAA